MSRKCIITKKGVLSGNNVSHSNRKTRRRFLPNIQKISLMSDALGRAIRMKISTNGVKTIDHNEGLDNYLISTSNSKLSVEARSLKKKIMRAKACKKICEEKAAS